MFNLKVTLSKLVAVQSSNNKDVTTHVTDNHNGTFTYSFQTNDSAAASKKKVITAYNLFILSCGLHWDPVSSVPHKRTWIRNEERVQQAIKTIDSAIDQYGLGNCAFSFNGGKDCTVLLQLLAERVQARNPSDQYRLKTFYVLPSHPFEEVERFCDEMQAKYNLDMHRYSADLSLKQALFQFHSRYPNIKAIFLGMRRTDPYAQALKQFSPCSEGWPPFMRVNPVLDWSYDDIWSFLLDRSALLNPEYCQLYCYGYTSIGGIDDTLPNPFLVDETAECGYGHACYLNDGNKHERAGRVPS